jgi:mRNA-degrading endonuclease toxin of MazEF toxin-antitoxin module
MTTPKRGHLYWAHMDKRCPVLVLSPDYRNELANDVIIVPGIDHGSRRTHARRIARR